MHQRVISQVTRLVFAGVCCVSWRFGEAAGGIEIDNSFGTARTLTGKKIEIRQDYGFTSGRNLFHSFKEFNVADKDTVVTFTSNTGDIKNVISRVTGGSQSEILGTLSSKIPNANFFLLNPNGVVFGKDAKIDMPAAFHVSTAASLKFADGQEFHAADSDSSGLSGAEPAAFGFLNGSSENNTLIPTKIEVVAGAQLVTSRTNDQDVAPLGQTVDLVGHSIDLNGFRKQPAKGADTLREVRIVAFQGDGAVSVLTDQKGHWDLPSQGFVDPGAGTLTIGTQANIRVTDIKAANDGKGAKANVFGGRIGVFGRTVAVKGTLTVNHDGSGDEDDLRKLEVRALESLIVDGGTLQTVATGVGNGGDLSVDAGAIKISNAGVIRTTATGSFSEAGSAGKLTVNSNSSITISGDGNQPTGIFSSTNRGGAGDLAVTADGPGGDIALRGTGAQISAESLGDGKAARVVVNSTGGNVIISGDGVKGSEFTGIRSNAGSARGAANDIAVDAKRNITITNGGQITNSGDETDVRTLRVSAGEDVSIDGQGSSARTGIYSAPSRADPDASNAVLGAKIIVQAGRNKSGKIKEGRGRVTVEDGGEIRAENWSDDSVQDAGSILIAAGKAIEIQKVGARVSTFNHSNSDGAGNIRLDGPRVTLSEQGTVELGPNDASKAGSFSVKKDTLRIRGGTILSPDGVRFIPIPALSQPQKIIDASGLNNLGTPAFDTHQVSPVECDSDDASSLVVSGRGGVRPRARDVLNY